MAKLLDLSNELLRKIAEYVLTSCHWKTQIQNLRLVNRRLSEVVDQTYPNGLRIGYKSTGSDQLCSFSNYVARHPARRNNMKIIKLHFYRAEAITKELSLNDLKLATPLYSGGLLSGDWELGQTIRVYPHIVALLSILPNIEELDLEMSKLKEAKIVSRLSAHQILQITQHVPSLRKLSLRSCCVDDGFLLPLGSWPYLLNLQTLQEFWMSGFDIADRHGRTRSTTYIPASDNVLLQCEPASLSIERISIDHCTMSDEHMKSLIRACRRLTHLDFGELHGVTSEQTDLDVEVWHEALSLHKDSLSHLTLDFMNDGRLRFYAHDPRNYQPLPKWPSFRSFHSLRVLEIQYRRMRCDHLPPSLHHLYLFDCREITDQKEVDDWQRIKSDYCPNITDVEIEMTNNCLKTQYRLKEFGIYMGSFLDRAHVCYVGGFRLSVWYRDFGDDALDERVEVYEAEHPLAPRGGWLSSMGYISEEYEEDEDYDPEQEVLGQDWDEELEMQRYLNYRNREMEEAVGYTSGDEFPDVETDEDEETYDEDAWNVDWEKLDQRLEEQPHVRVCYLVRNGR